jgi:hypothetical protein
MSAGYQVSAASLNNRTGDVAAQVFGAFAEIRKVKAFLDAYTAQGLVDTFPGIDLAAANDIKSAYTELEQLANIFDGAVNLGAAKDFRTFPKRLIGVGQY